MCSTCGCGKKADTFEAPKRQRIGNRFISRRKDGTISKNVDVGRSLSADRRRKAKTTASAGQGDKGDLKRAESKFDKLSNEIAKDYEKKGKSKDEAEEIGKATAYKIGVAKYGKRGMERKARAGRAKNAESFGADEKKRSGMKIAPKIQMVNYEDVMTEKMKNQNMKDAESFNADSDKWISSMRVSMEELEKWLPSLRVSLEEAEKWADSMRVSMEELEKVSFDAQYVIVHGEDGRRKAHKTGFEERDGFTPQYIERTMTEQLGDYVPSDSAIENVAFENHAENFEAESNCEQELLQCREALSRIEHITEQKVVSDSAIGYIHNLCQTVLKDVRPKHTNIPNFDAESFDAESNCEQELLLCREALSRIEHLTEQKVGWYSAIGYIHNLCQTVLKDARPKHTDIPNFDAEYTTVQRPHHVARVRNENIGGGKHGLEQWNKPNMHTDANKKGKMYDEERGGWVEMDDKARSMFEEIGGKISDFDVVGTTQDVVGKTGFNIPTGVASIAVVFMAYMTGKKYGN